MQTLSPIFCIHKVNDIVTLGDGEVICGNCGVVLGREDTTTYSIKSARNLFLDVTIGSKNNYTIPSSRYIRPNNPDLIKISNICRTLNIPNSVSNDIWYWYNKIRANINTTKAKILVLVFYQLCRYNKIPINESHLMIIIKTQLGVTNIHTSLFVLSEIYSFLDSIGIPIIEKIGFTKYTTHDAIFLLRCKVKTLNGHYSPDVVSQVNDTALEMLCTISGSERFKANRAFHIAKQRCGVFCESYLFNYWYSYTIQE